MKVPINLVYTSVVRVGDVLPFTNRGEFLGYVTICGQCYIKMLISPRQYTFRGRANEGNFTVLRPVVCPECGWICRIAKNTLLF